MTPERRPGATEPSTERGWVRRMDPRLSARRTAVIREQGRRRLLIASVALGAAALLVGGWFLVHTPLFSARSVTVTGNLHESAAQVVSQLIGVAIVIIYDVIASFIILKVIDLVVGLRVDEEVERDGLDLALHGEMVQ